MKIKRSAKQYLLQIELIRMFEEILRRSTWLMPIHRTTVKVALKCAQRHLSTLQNGERGVPGNLVASERSLRHWIDFCHYDLFAELKALEHTKTIHKYLLT